MRYAARMQNALAVGMGGFLGCIARYLVGVMVAHLVAAPVLPYATLLVNVVGCLLIGVLSTLAERPAGLSPPLQLFLMVGLLGGFTTYSTFGYQTVTLARTGQGGLALLNVAAHLLLGLGAVWCGIWLAQHR